MIKGSEWTISAARDNKSPTTLDDVKHRVNHHGPDSNP